jgi:hypothetical protein
LPFATHPDGPRTDGTKGRLFQTGLNASQRYPIATWPATARRPRPTEIANICRNLLRSVVCSPQCIAGIRRTPDFRAPQRPDKVRICAPMGRISAPPEPARSDDEFVAALDVRLEVRRDARRSGSSFPPPCAPAPTKSSSKGP